MTKMTSKCHQNDTPVETVVEVDEDDPPCMDIYTSGAIRVADATFIFPMMYGPLL